ncbi:MAG: hypothetical protein ACI4F0_01075 [Agathobacter sp.]
MYINNKDKYEDTKSTGWTFVLVGGIGLLGVILMDLGVFPFQMQSYMKIIFSIVMGALFLIFLAIGIKSFLSLKQIKTDAKDQEETENEVVSWFLSHYAEEMKVYHTPDMNEEDSDTLYYPRAEKMEKLITAEYKNLSADELDHLVERLYSEIFQTTDNI